MRWPKQIDRWIHRPVPSPWAAIHSGASIYGVYDMAGNVAEWVSDWYSERYYQEQAARGTSLNPAGPLAGQQKVLRGGSWNGVPFFSRAMHRQSEYPGEYQRWVGFRCAEDPLDVAAIGSSNLNPATLGVDVPAAQPQTADAGGAQPTQPPPPDANRPAGT